ncbi:MAG TPA: winged helix-turn-helix domain-containing protein [Solirubrobacterales bacterium]|jgi:DNA-binding transcriptional ArsR family regulator|nr:winged helix-turn-helix domain-containing protein [Solirubrobacterales bacterium]
MSARSGKEKTAEETSQRLVKALAHPTRVRILGVLSHRDISPAEFARESGEVVTNVAYHFRELAKYGFAEVAETRPVRGSMEHIYTGTKQAFFGEEEWRLMPKPLQRLISGTVLHDMVGKMTEAVEAGTFDSRDDRHFTWTPLVVDEEGWTDLMSILDTAFEQIGEVAARAGERLAEQGCERIPATVALAGFESPKSRGKSS